MKDLTEIFAKVRSHLLAQQALSVDDDGTCRLRGQDGRRCAIGILIDDAHYGHPLEGLGISYYKTGQDGPLLRALAMSGVDVYRAETLALLHDLEDLHDAGDVAEWPLQLSAVAKRHAIALTEDAMV
jgi:hypothetical protein